MSTNSNPWQSTPPTEPGRWEMRCMETEFQPSPVMVFPMYGELWVEVPDIGTNTMGRYHHNLCSIEWRRAESVPPAKAAVPLPERVESLVQNAASQAETNAVLIRRLTAAEAKVQIYEHALRLIANDKTNPEGWATDKQIADHYLRKAAQP